jgi:hypothetical protein
MRAAARDKQIDTCKMKSVTPIAVLLVLAGCRRAETPPRLGPAQTQSAVAKAPRYMVLTDPPDAALDKMLILYSPNNPEWPRVVDELIKDNHPILRHVIRYLAETRAVSAAVANEINDRIDASPVVELSGQRAIALLETACYADVVCHEIEYPLRVATLDYVKANRDSQDVDDALLWILSDYHSGLPLDSPGDETGDFRGMLVEAMQGRLTQYVRQLMVPKDLTRKGK